MSPTPLHVARERPVARESISFDQAACPRVLLALVERAFSILLTACDCLLAFLFLPPCSSLLYSVHLFLLSASPQNLCDRKCSGDGCNLDSLSEHIETRVDLRSGLTVRLCSPDPAAGHGQGWPRARVIWRIWTLRHLIDSPQKSIQYSAIHQEPRARQIRGGAHGCSDIR